MISILAFFFRSLNSQLLYTQGLINKLLKAPYFASLYAFKWWVKKKRPTKVAIIENYDRDLKIQVDISKTMGASMFWTGFHEFNEMRFLNRYLKEDMIFVDVGANQGEFSLFASKRLRKGVVLAFEPLSFFYERLAFNISLNNIKNIKAFRLGLSDHSAEVPIYCNANNELEHEGLASLYPLDEKDQITEVISLVELDKVVMLHGIKKIDFIKIDVEGSEWAVLRGAEHVLRKFKPLLLVELNDETSARVGYKVTEMLEWLKQFGYEAFQIVRNELTPLKMRPPFCNAVFIAR
jgi:FkbM family methyltransferase